MSDPDANGPVWPEGVRERERDDEAKTAVLRGVPRGPGELVLLGVDGWDVTLDVAHHRSLWVVRVEGPPLRALGLKGRGQVVLQSGMELLRLAGSGDGLSVTLEAEVPRIEFSGGTCVVDAPEGEERYYEAFAATTMPELAEPFRAATTIRGSAHVQRLSGSGSVQLDAPVVWPTDGSFLSGFEGAVGISSGLDGVTITAPRTALHLNGELSNSNLEVGALFSTASVERSTVEALDAVAVASAEASTLCLTSGDPNSQVVFGAASRPLAAAESLAESGRRGQLLARFDSAGHASACRIEVASGHVFVGELMGCEVSVGGSLFVKNSMDLTPLAVGDEAGVAPGVRAGQHVWLGEDCELADATIDADGEVAAAGPVANGILRCAKLVQAPLLTEVIAEASSSALVGRIVGGSLTAATIRVTGSAEDTELSGDTLTLGTGLSLSRVLARKELKFGKGADDGSTAVDEGSKVEVLGSAVIPKGFAGDLIWKPSDGQKQKLTLASSPDTLRVVGGPEVAVKVTILEPAFAWHRLEVEGKVCFQREVPEGARVARPGRSRIEKLVVRDSDAQVIFDGITLDVAKCDAAAGAELTVCPDSELSIAVSEVDGMLIAAHGKTTLRTIGSDPRAAVQLLGPGPVTVEGNISYLECPVGHRHDLPDEVIPLLNIPHEHSVVSGLSGWVRLGQVNGRVEGATDGFSWSRFKLLVARVLAWVRAPRALRIGARPLEYLRPDAPARVIKVVPQAEHDLGYVVGIDPNWIPYGELRNAAAFHVFEPSSHALIDWARARRETDADRRHAAWGAMRLAEQVRSSAASGSARSAAMWAAARTQHAAASWRSGEWYVKWVHRAFGYSHRPGPPLLTYLLMAALWAQLVSDPRAFGPEDDAAVGWWKMFLMPAAWLLRIQGDGRHEYLSDGWYLAAFVMIGLPFVFFVVALRNYMAPPETLKR